MTVGLAVVTHALPAITRGLSRDYRRDDRARDILVHEVLTAGVTDVGALRIRERHDPPWRPHP
jgi:hypothetical protein